MAVCQNLVPLVNIKKAGKWMFIPLKMVLIGIDPYPYKIPLCAFVSLRSAMRSSSSSDVLRFRSAAALRPCHFVEASRGWK